MMALLNEHYWMKCFKTIYRQRIVQTFNNSLSNVQNTLCMGSTMVSSGSDPSTNRFTWCLSWFIVENRAWTEKERTKHFEKLKSATIWYNFLLQSL